VVAHWAIPCAFPIAFDSVLVAGTGELKAELEVVSHGSDVGLLERLPAPIRRKIVTALSERASEWRFVSAELLARLARTVPERLLRNATVRPCAIEIPNVDALAEAKRRTMPGPFVSTIGRLVASKRVDRIVEVAAAERVPLVVVGDGPERSRLERAAKGTRFVGHVPREEALAWMRASSALWYAARDEGLPTVLREAEALGVPVRMLD
jgi:glycosyltransferase involved in cell wall biosynthesis